MAEIVVEWSPLAEFLDEMPSLIMQYKQMQMAQDERVLEREHEKSKMYLTHNLNRLERLNQELSNLETSEMQLGLVGTELSKSPDVSSGALDVMDASEQDILNNIDLIQSKIDDRKVNISNYYSGLNLAKTLDKDISGSISDIEMEGVPEDAMNNPAFLYGVQSYTLDPIQMQNLRSAKTQDELAKVALEVERVKAQFIPKQLQDEKDLRKINLNTAGVNLEILNENKKQAVINTDIATKNVALLDLQISSTRDKIDQENYIYDQQLRVDAQTSIDKAIIENMQAQTDFGANILANISLELEDDEVIPMFSILASENQEKMLEDINDSKALSLIRQDVLDLYSGYGIGKAEEQLPDYSLIFNTVEDIVGYREAYNDFIRQHSFQLEEAAQRFGLNKNSYKVVNHVLSMADPNLFNRETIMKAVQWNRTGIYQNLPLLNNALKANQQAIDLNAMKEQALALDIEYSSEKYKNNIYSEDEINNMTYPFTSITDYRSDPESLNEDIYRIFQEEDIFPRDYPSEDGFGTAVGTNNRRMIRN